MKIRDIMTKNVECSEPTASMTELAKKMRDSNVGSIPICENSTLQGIVSDRDLVTRCLAENQMDAKACDIMSADIVFGYPEMSAEEAGQLMSEHQIRRLPILENERIAGIVALGDLSVEKDTDQKAGEALSEISKSA
ncbi:CBS domain-containing protein [Bacillus inaquosorum]|uniref:CBS domain-containing protein n=1 Tax=Bacillus inaquosorum TaxID=483913 RepID=UPI0022816197|nr:CBS domain-containing protein [Bacillus inaquosorum]MCY7964415.1 CBS domain-containing protein [Bacillus inaquosorum]MCY8491866.1 CBS domain-containing protein [Bacillus inaquosorum]MCY8693935.1 CBS domain-containing protein [Bacillus inaquosorum]